MKVKNKIIKKSDNEIYHSSFKILKSLYNLSKLATKSDFSKLSSFLILIKFLNSSPVYDRSPSNSSVIIL